MIYIKLVINNFFFFASQMYLNFKILFYNVFYIF